MKPSEIAKIAEELDKRAQPFAIGDLQDIRKTLKGFAKRPGSTIFSEQTIKDTYAFHHGGRTELQYNFGQDGIDTEELRHGVAFSLELSQALPSIDVLVPKIKLFNDYIQLNATAFADMRMWHWDAGERSDDYLPSPIPASLVRPKVFIFLGKREPTKPIDYDVILEDFDRLLPLYRYVESGGTTAPVTKPTSQKFTFKPGCTVKATKAKATYTEKELDLDLRHVELQKALHARLAKKHGADNVGTEIKTGVGTQIDVVLKNGKEYWYYEIKTALTARGCLREALGQIMEYSYWPGATAPARLIVIGEAELDKDAEQYLGTLRKQFSLPIYYERVVVK